MGARIDEDYELQERVRGLHAERQGAEAERDSLALRAARGEADAVKRTLALSERLRGIEDEVAMIASARRLLAPAVEEERAAEAAASKLAKRNTALKRFEQALDIAKAIDALWKEIGEKHARFAEAANAIADTKMVDPHMAWSASQPLVRDGARRAAGYLIAGEPGDPNAQSMEAWTRASLKVPEVGSFAYEQAGSAR